MPAFPGGRAAPHGAMTVAGARHTTNKDAMPYVFMFFAMLMLTMLVACVVSI